MWTKICFVVLAVTAASLAHAQGATARGSAVEVALSNDTLQLRYLREGENLGIADTQASAAFFLSEERDIVLSAGLLFTRGLEWGRLSARFGPRAFAALLEDENDDVLAVSVGTELRFDLDRSGTFALAGHAFYSPDILTFGSADNLTDLMARAEYRVTPQLAAFAGMRWFEFDLNQGGGERTLQEEIFVGASWRFE